MFSYCDKQLESFLNPNTTHSRLTLSQYLVSSRQILSKIHSEEKEGERKFFLFSLFFKRANIALCVVTRQFSSSDRRTRNACWHLQLSVSVHCVRPTHQRFRRNRNSKQEIRLSGRQSVETATDCEFSTSDQRKSEMRRDRNRTKKLSEILFVRSLRKTP